MRNPSTASGPLVTFRAIFAGFTDDETAGILGVSDGTVEATCHYARLWLLRELQG